MPMRGVLARANGRKFQRLVTTFTKKSESVDFTGGISVAGASTDGHTLQNDMRKHGPTP